MSFLKPLILTTIAAATLGAATPAWAFRIFISNEKDNTITVLDGNSFKVLSTVSVGARPRGIVLSRDGKSLYICTSDADHIEELDLTTLTVKRTLPSNPDPEYMALSHDGKTLYVANENNSEVSVLDVAAGRITSEIPVGVEPEGMAVSPDDRIVICTSETTSMAHFINVATHQLDASVLVGSRPRFAAFSKDGTKLWVSSEVAGTVAIIDVATHKILKTIHFDLPEVPKASIQAVGINLESDGKYAFVSLGPANRVAVIDQTTYDIKKYLLVGQRVWHADFSPDQKLLFTANGISNDMSVIDVPSLDVTQSVPVGQSPWGVVVAPEAPPEAALSVVGISHAFGTRDVLHDVSFAVRPSDFSVLLGLNGAGKTTLFALITRLYHSRKGRIAVYGNDVERAPLAALARLGVVFQQSTLDLDLTVGENLYYHASLHGMSRVKARPRIEEELERIGLASRARDRVRSLSGGQRRRVELARALVHEPALLLLDEPTVGLDIESRRFLLDHVHNLCTTRGLGVLWATHLIDEAEGDTRILVLHHGRILADGPRESVLGKTAAPTLKDAFDSLTRKVAA